MTDSQSALSATTTSGAMARIGTVCDATTYGTKRPLGKPGVDEQDAETEPEDARRGRTRRAPRRR